MSASENGGCITLVIGFVIGAALVHTGMSKKLKEADRYKGQVTTLRTDLAHARAEAANARSLRTKLEAAETQLVAAEHTAEWRLKQHERELALAEQKAQVESRLAGIEEGKAIAETLIEQLVKDKEQSSALIETLNSRMQILVSDLKEQLKSVEALIADQSSRVTEFGWLTVSLIVAAMIAILAAAVGGWKYICMAEAARDLHSVGQVIASGVAQKLISMPLKTSRRRLIRCIEDDLRGRPVPPNPSDFRFEPDEEVGHDI